MNNKILSLKKKGLIALPVALSYVIREETSKTIKTYIPTKTIQRFFFKNL